MIEAADARDVLAEIFEDLEAARDEVEEMFELGGFDPSGSAGQVRL